MSTGTQTPDGPTDAPARSRRPRRTVVLVALAAVLALGGVTLVGLSFVDDRPVPPSIPTAAAAPTLEPVPAAAAAVAGTAGAARAPSPPVSIDIPAIGVSSEVNPVGRNPDGSVEVPAKGPLYDEAAWYRYSVTPGEIGPSVLLGHVDSAANGPSVFFDLAKVRPGGSFTVTRADGSVLAFRVDGVRAFPKDAFPTQLVYGGTERPEIRLVTCGGEFDRGARSYVDNTVVFGHLI